MYSENPTKRRQLYCNTTEKRDFYWVKKTPRSFSLWVVSGKVIGQATRLLLKQQNFFFRLLSLQLLKSALEFPRTLWGCIGEGGEGRGEVQLQEQPVIVQWLQQIPPPANISQSTESWGWSKTYKHQTPLSLNTGCHPNSYKAKVQSVPALITFNSSHHV